MSFAPIYLDGFSTNALAPEAVDAMLAAWAFPGNASSQHVAGQRGYSIIEGARREVASLIGCSASEVFFTSGATEANNLAVRGVADWALQGGSARRRIVVSAIEHKSVFEVARGLASEGLEVVYAPVDGRGVVDLCQLDGLIDSNTLLISVMSVNNETGAIQPIREIGELSRSRGALFHTDAAQAVGKITLDVFEWGVDYLSVSAHKLHGPMGVGALYVASDAPKPVAQVLGGGQERGMRSGTEPVPLIAGFGAAAAVAGRQISADGIRGIRLANALLEGLVAAGIKVRLITGDAPVVPGGLVILFENQQSDDILAKISRNVCVSSGSACSSGQIYPSRVLMSMGLTHDEASSVLRFYFSRYNDEGDVAAALEFLVSACSA